MMKLRLKSMKRSVAHDQFFPSTTCVLQKGAGRRETYTRLATGAHGVAAVGPKAAHLEDPMAP